MSNMPLSCGYVAMLAAYPSFWYYAEMVKMHPGRRYDLYWEDPFKYSEHLKEMGEYNVLFTFYKLKKYRIDAREFMRQHFHGFPWKAYIFHPDCTILIDYTCEPRETKGSWPSWYFRQYDLEELGDYIQTPWNARIPDELAEWWDIPHVDQPHRVFCWDVLVGKDEIDRHRRRRLSKIQRLYPEVELFIKPAVISYSLLFGSGFAAACVDPYRHRWDSRGAFYAPNGRVVHLERVEEFSKEIEYLGFDPHEVRYDQDIGLLYFIASLRYAAHHWHDSTGPCTNKSGRQSKPDFWNPDMYAEMPSYSNTYFNQDKIKDTDKILCDSCSLWRKCPTYRSGEVCGVNGTDGKRLSELALSRNADDVVEMLASIVSKQAERVEKKINNEQFTEGGFDKDIDKMLNNVFKNGTSLAKLRNPNLGRPLIQINANITPEQQKAKEIAAADPRALAMGVIEEIEATGVKREDITEEMIEKHIQSNYGQKQIEGEVLDAEVEDD